MDVCAHCGKDFVSGGVGHPKKFCCQKCQVSAWRESNRESMLLSMREYSKSYSRERPPDVSERRRIYNRQWRLSNPHYKHQYYIEHPGQHRTYNENRRARLMNAEGRYTEEEFSQLCQSVGNKCVCCGRKIKLTVDHIVPLSAGGTNYIENIQPLCQSCNCSKRTKTISYMEERISE